MEGKGGVGQLQQQQGLGGVVSLSQQQRQGQRAGNVEQQQQQQQGQGADTEQQQQELGMGGRKQQGHPHEGGPPPLHATVGGAHTEGGGGWAAGLGSDASLRRSVHSVLQQQFRPKVRMCVCVCV